jgi:hypothetical protein
LEITHAYEETYLNELVAYQLQFEGYKYDRLTCKLVEVLVIVFHKFSHVQATTVVTSSPSELVVTTIENFEPIRGGAKLTIVSCTLPLPTKLMEVFFVVVNTRVEALEELVTVKPIPLIILEIGIGEEVTLIDIIAHASEIFKTPNIILKDTFVA